MEYITLSLDAFKRALQFDYFKIEKDELSGFNRVIDNTGRYFQCQDNINQELPIRIYLEKGLPVGKAKFFNTNVYEKPYDKFHTINFRSDGFKNNIGRVLQINLKINPSSQLGSRGVNDIISEYKEIVDGKSRYSFEVKQGKQLSKFDYRSVFTFQKHKLKASVDKLIIYKKGFDFIHWSTTNIPWFYFDYNKRYFEGLSMIQIYKKYADAENQKAFESVLKVFNTKKIFHDAILADDAVSRAIFQENEHNRILHQEWLRSVRDDWMDEPDNYWNID